MPDNPTIVTPPPQLVGPGINFIYGSVKNSGGLFSATYPARLLKLALPRLLTRRTVWFGVRGAVAAGSRETFLEFWLAGELQLRLPYTYHGENFVTPTLCFDPNPAGEAPDATRNIPSPGCMAWHLADATNAITWPHRFWLAADEVIWRIERENTSGANVLYGLLAVLSELE
jgi:hypothetical protein